ncbi:MAG TPA: WD40 repeat domain-containing protein [Candidatus Bathyarchaeia archaeon]|nr:WD40 repeat domain-containing protein [Candidatus Bathyarchaeia archaeon]
MKKIALLLFGGIFLNLFLEASEKEIKKNTKKAFYFELGPDKRIYVAKNIEFAKKYHTPEEHVVMKYCLFLRACSAEEYAERTHIAMPNVSARDMYTILNTIYCHAYGCPADCSVDERCNVSLEKRTDITESKRVTEIVKHMEKLGIGCENAESIADFLCHSLEFSFFDRWMKKCHGNVVTKKYGTLLHALLEKKQVPISDLVCTSYGFEHKKVKPFTPQYSLCFLNNDQFFQYSIHDKHHIKAYDIFPSVARALKKISDPILTTNKLVMKNFFPLKNNRVALILCQGVNDQSKRYVGIWNLAAHKWLRIVDIEGDAQPKVCWNKTENKFACSYTQQGKWNIVVKEGKNSTKTESFLLKNIDEIRNCAFLSNGQLRALCRNGGVLSVWESQQEGEDEYKKIAQISKKYSPVITKSVLSPGGRYINVGALVYDIGKKRWTIFDEKTPYIHTTWSCDGKFLGTMESSGLLTCWDAKKRKKIGTIQLPVSEGKMFFSANGLMFNYSKEKNYDAWQYYTLFLDPAARLKKYVEMKNG